MRIGTGEILTFQDVYEDVLYSFDAFTAQTGPTKNIARRACLDAYRRLPQMHSWAGLLKRGRILTQPMYSEGTIEYDHTGGANERQVTLTGGVWPDYAEFCVLEIGGVQYHVEKRISNTVITLQESLNPGRDISPGTAYRLYRTRYRMPEDFFRLRSRLESSRQWQCLEYVSQESWLDYLGQGATASYPCVYTFFPSEDEYGTIEIELLPPPTDEVEYDFVYEYRPASLKTFGGQVQYDTGNVTVSGTTVNGSGTAWTSDMAGAVIRFSRTASPATGPGGSNPFQEQRIIASVSGPSTLTIDSALDGTYTSVGYSISSIVDLPSHLLLLLQRMADMEYALRRQRSAEQIARLRLALDDTYTQAAIADRKYGEIQSASVSEEYLRGVPIEVDLAPAG